MKKRLGAGAFALWIAPISALMIEQKLMLDCPDEYVASYVEKHFGNVIRAVLQELGIGEFSFSSGVEKQAIQKEKQEELQQQHQRQEEGRNRELTALPQEKQFAELVAAYPRKSVYGEYFAKLTFYRLRRRGELPELPALLRIIDKHKASADWHRDQGRWIPGLNKWLRAKPWKN